MLVLIAAGTTGRLWAGQAEYQWSVPVPSVTSGETQKAPRAFLWVPPDCERVRCVVLGQHNMLEEPLLEHPVFRQALAELGFAAVWVSPSMGGAAQFGAQEEAQFDEMLRLLSSESGYEEIASAPVVPVGHSALADFPYLFAAARPARTLAAISIKGSWPEPSKPWANGATRGVPLLLVSGEYEWAEERAGKSLWFRREFPHIPFSMLAEAGGGHFDCGDSLVEFLGDYLRAAARHRLGNPLREIDAAREGWLVDRWRMNTAPRTGPSPVSGYAGPRNETFWCFDETHALRTEKAQAAFFGKTPQLVGYSQAGQVVPQDPKTHQQVTLKFLPEEDGLTFKVAGAFLNAVPEGRPVRWTGQPAGANIAHADGSVNVSRICGPVERLENDRFALRFDRVGFDNPKRSNNIWLLAEHPGDAVFKRAVQQSTLHFPLRNEEGEPQVITFPTIASQNAGSSELLPLKATSSAKTRVSYYVREGPAEITRDGKFLKFTRIPPRAKFPLKVTVVAWQWGKTTAPRIRTAEPVEQTFLLHPNKLAVKVEAKSGAGLAIPSGFAGFSREWRPFPTPPDGEMSQVHPVYLRLLEHLSAYNKSALSIRVGGASADGMRTPPDLNRWRQIAQVFKATRTPLIINVGLARGNAELAREWIQAANEHLPPGAVASFELGNEPDGWPKRHKPQDYTFENYQDEFAAIGKQLVPELTQGLAGPAWAHGAPPEIIGPYIQRQQGLLNLITVHAYRFDPKTDPALERLLRNSATAGMAEFLKPGIQVAHEAGLPIRLAETGSAWGGGIRGFSDSQAAAIFTLDYLFELANAGLDGVNLHGGGSSAYTPIEEDVDTKTWKTRQISARPPYYGMLVFAEAASNGAEIIPTYPAGGQSPFAKLWATRDKSGVVRIVAMNKSLNARAEFSISGLHGNGSLKRLLAPTPSSKEGLTWAGQTFDASKDGNPMGFRQVEELHSRQGEFTLSLHPATAALLTIDAP
jgi:hypothetical protein